MRSRFNRGSGCYACSECGKQTREVEHNQGTSLCELCAIKCECGNSLSDNGHEGDAWALFRECGTARECYELLEQLTTPSDA